MVEFCADCGTSLPSADLTISNGSLFVSHDYNCPECGKPVNPEPRESGPFTSTEEHFCDERDVLISQGTVEHEPAAHPANADAPRDVGEEMTKTEWNSNAGNTPPPTIGDEQHDVQPEHDEENDDADDGVGKNDADE